MLAQDIVVLRARRRGRALGRLVVVLGLLACSLALHPQPTAAAPLTLRQWALKFLVQLGVPATRPTAARVQFLMQWSKVEDSFENGNTNNPLDTEMRVKGAGLYNSAGVKTYPSLLMGFRATLFTLQQEFDHPILAALRNRRTTIQALGLALAQSNWTGFGQGSWNEQVYASEVAGLPVSTFKLPQPTVSIRGVVVDPLQRRVAGVCVAAVNGNAVLAPVHTAANGTFLISNLSRAPYRLQISDCQHLFDDAPVADYDAKGGASHLSPTRATATVLSSTCTLDKACPSQSINIPDVITYGILTSRITWPTPAPVNYGTRLSAKELDARASVPGWLRYSLSRGTLLEPGTHTVTVTFRPHDPTGFTSAHTTQQIVVSRAPPKVTWKRPAPMTAGTPLSTAQLDAVASVPGTFVYSPPLGTVLGPGNHTVSVRFQPTDLTHYRAVIDQVTMLVLAPILSP